MQPKLSAFNWTNFYFITSNSFLLWNSNFAVFPQKVFIFLLRTNIINYYWLLSTTFTCGPFARNKTLASAYHVHQSLKPFFENTGLCTTDMSEQRAVRYTAVKCCWCQCWYGAPLQESSSMPQTALTWTLTSVYSPCTSIYLRLSQREKNLHLTMSVLYTGKNSILLTLVSEQNFF